MTVNWQRRGGLLNVWRPDRWVVQFYHPWIWYTASEGFRVDLDTSARFGRRAFGFRVLGFGVGGSIAPYDVAHTTELGRLRREIHELRQQLSALAPESKA